jgi:ssDNA-binding Zn-finger/Zn-ribbon topoisomerase 1
MAAWGLGCPNCNKQFAQFQIEDEDTLENYFFPAKPDFPEDGKKFECPNCGHKATCQRNNLVYMP